MHLSFHSLPQFTTVSGTCVLCGGYFLRECGTFCPLFLLIMASSSSSWCFNYRVIFQT